MATWLVSRQELTPEQVRAIEMDSKQNRVILGGPGSGKTQVLLFRGKHLKDLRGVENHRFRIFVFTKALREYIQSALNLLDLPDDSVLTLDSWCMAYFKEYIGGKCPWNQEQRMPDFAAIRKRVLEDLVSNQRRLYDFVIIDEAQDLNEIAFQLLKAMATHITVCVDHKQQIYDDGSEVNSILKWLGVRQSNIMLLETYRCCPYIVQLASLLIDNVNERIAYVNQARTDQSERETPMLVYSSSFEEEKEQLIDLVRVRLARGERIAVLFPHRRQAFGYAKGFTEAGIEVENPKQIDFSTDKPKIMPYHSAKGLTFDSVFLPRLTQKAFGDISEERIKRLLFVGITRATGWVCLSTTDRSELPILNRLIEAEDEGFLTIRRQAEATPPHESEEADPIEQDDLSDLL